MPTIQIEIKGSEGPAAVFEAALFERDADFIVFSPCDAARQAQSVVRDTKHKAFGDTHLGGNLYLGSGKGKIADHAINRPAAGKFNPCGFRDAVARCGPGFGHVQTIGIECSPQ